MRTAFSIAWALVAMLVQQSCCRAADSPPAYNYREQQQWDRFTGGEQSNFSNRGEDKVPQRVREQQMRDAAAREKERNDRSVSIGSFQVPSWVVTQAPTYQRPIEVVNGQGLESTVPSYTSLPGSGFSGFAGTWGTTWPVRSYAWAPSYGWGGVGGGWGLPNLGATLGVASAIGFAGGLPGIGYGGWGIPGLGGWGWRGYGGWGGLGGYGGWGGLGGYGGWGGYGGYGGWSPAAAALGFRRGAICDPGGSVYQSAPSKASGNYYQPSTVDPSASGGYYASGSQTPVQIAPSEPPPKDYWGPDGDPFKQQRGPN